MERNAEAEKGAKTMKRTWFKCENPNCGCTWYDDAENSFDGCPECGANFYILDEEIRKIEFEY